MAGWFKNMGRGLVGECCPGCGHRVCCEPCPPKLIVTISGIEYCPGHEGVDVNGIYELINPVTDDAGTGACYYETTAPGGNKVLLGFNAGDPDVGLGDSVTVSVGKESDILYFGAGAIDTPIGNSAAIPCYLEGVVTGGTATVSRPVEGGDGGGG